MNANEILAPQAPEVFKMLGHDVRWQLMSLLRRSDCRVHELVRASGRPQNLVSYHLRQLRDLGLVHERRGDADNRDVYYHLDLGYLQKLLHQGGQLLHPALGAPATATSATDEAVSVLFLCTHNSARSQMAEALLRARGPASLQVFSAGSEPAAVHPLAVEAMSELGIDMGGQVAKHLDQYDGQHFDYVITVCDRVREVCPVFGNETKTIHWSIADPAAAAGSLTERHGVFRQTAAELATRIDFLLPALLSERPKGRHI